MIRNYVPKEVKYEVRHDLIFYYDETGGFAFPCDATGNVFPLEYEDARKNLAYCLEHPEKFSRWNEVNTYKVRVDEPAHGTCTCGQEVVLTDEYCGACQCHICGRWYNLFGQELLPPEEWETDPSEDEYW